MIECPECGTENTDEAYCKNCGIELEMPSEQPSSKSDESWFKSHKDFLTIVIVIVGVIAIAMIVYGMSSTSEPTPYTGSGGETSSSTSANEESVLDVEVTKATYATFETSYLVIMEITNNSDKQVTFFPDRFELRLKTARGQNDIIGHFELESTEYMGYVDRHIFSPNESASFMGGFYSYNKACESNTFPYEITIEGKIVSEESERFIKETFSGETTTRIWEISKRD